MPRSASSRWCSPGGCTLRFGRYVGADSRDLRGRAEDWRPAEVGGLWRVCGGFVCAVAFLDSVGRPTGAGVGGGGLGALAHGPWRPFHAPSPTVGAQPVTSGRATALFTQ